MSISEWFKRIFSSPARSDAPAEVAHETDEETTIDEARIDAGGSGALGFPGEPDSHASPADDLAETESEPQSDA